MVHRGNSDNALRAQHMQMRTNTRGLREDTPAKGLGLRQVEGRIQGEVTHDSEGTERAQTCHLSVEARCCAPLRGRCHTKLLRAPPQIWQGLR